MRYFTKCLSLALCAAVLLSLPALAAESASAPEDPAPAKVFAPVQVWGKAAKLEGGSLLITSTESDAVNPEVVVHLPEGTPCVDAATGLPMDMNKVKDGDILYTWVGPAMTMSLPPQTNALVVVGNVKSGGSVPQFYEIIGGDDWAVTANQEVPKERPVLNLPVAGDQHLEVPRSAQFTPWLTRQIVTADDLIPGSQVLVWKDKDGKAEKVLLFPYAYRGYIGHTGDGSVSVNGEQLETKGMKAEKWWEPQYVPLRAVAESVGYTVKWVPGKGAVVSDGGVERFSVLPGSETAKTPDGEDELTAPCIVRKGVTYLDLMDMARLLNLYICGR